MVFLYAFYTAGLGVWVIGSRSPSMALDHRPYTDIPVSLAVANHRTAVRLQAMHGNTGNAARPPSCALGLLTPSSCVQKAYCWHQEQREQRRYEYALRFPATVLPASSGSPATTTTASSIDMHAFFYARLGSQVPEGSPPARQPRCAGGLVVRSS